VIFYTNVRGRGRATLGWSQAKHTWWFVVDRGEPDACFEPPAYETDVAISAFTV
jgi:hypothetical protein